MEIYRRIARISRAPYADSMLARAALDRGDISAARRYAERLPESATRDDLLGSISLARGDVRAARQYYVRAGDVEAIARVVDALGKSDPASAYALELALIRRLQQTGTHPDAVAEGYWQLGVLASREAKPKVSLRDYETAVALSPLSEKYSLSAGYAAYDMGAYAAALRHFARVLSVDPASADAYAGEGMVAFHEGDRARAAQFAQRARSIDPHAHSLATLQSYLNAKP